MANNKGKQFETTFKVQWQEQFPNTFLLRLYDTTSGFAGVANPCDFIAFIENNLFLIECKSHEGASIPFDSLRQYDKLLNYKDLKGVHAGFLIWFIDKDCLCWVPIDSAQKIKDTGVKSISVKCMDDPESGVIKIPAEKKRVFLNANYKYLVEKLTHDAISTS